MKIHHANKQFDFSKLYLASPTALHGSFYSKIIMNTSDDSVYMYTPACSTKQGVVTSGQRQYIDLVFSASNSNFIEWLENLEERIQKLLFEKKTSWFVDDDIELDDIQNSFMPIMKIKGNQYVLRAYIPQGKHGSAEHTIHAYNEDELPVPLSSIKESSQLICILDISGIKFSQKSFQVVVNIRQFMILEKTSFSTCLIKNSQTKTKSMNKEIVKEIDINLEDSVKETIVIKTPNELYKSALDRANKFAEEAEHARIIAEELKSSSYDFEE